MPFGQAVAKKGISFSSSLEEEIDKFQFEEEETQGVEAIVISEAKEETDEYSCIQTPAPIVTYVEDSSDNKAEKNGFKIWQKFERAYEEEEHNAYPPRNP